MKKYLRIFFLLQTIRIENQRGILPSSEFLINKLKERFVDDHNGFSYRTLLRDFQTIRREIKINIYFQNGGFIVDESDFDQSIITGTIEAFEIFSSVNLQSGMPDFVVGEKRKSSGLEHFYFLVKSIISKTYIKFNYQKYDSDEQKFYEIAPYALKESRHRWYVIGVKKGENELRSFGLDRIFNLAQIDGNFKPKFNIEEINAHFANSFAMFTDGEVENVVLKFDKRDGNYIKSFPIHDSQKILSEDEKSVTLSLQIRITLDFMMELMSRAWSVEVLEPISLRQKLAGIFREAAGRNGIN